MIVGAGSAGCVLAHRLSEDPDVRVLLLEAGPADRKAAIHVPAAGAELLRTRVDWRYRTRPQAGLGHRPIPWPRGRTLGGSSSINALVYLRGHREDFDAWARLGNTGWAFDDVLPYFRRAERGDGAESDTYGTAGCLVVTPLPEPHPLVEALVRGGVEVGLRPNDDLNDGTLEGVGYFPATQRHGRRWSTSDAFLRPALSRPNLTVLTGAHATGVLVEKEVATGVTYRRDGQAHTARADREVLLSGGVVNSPQLLLLSGIGPAEHLRAHAIPVTHHLPGVGRNLRDHLTVPVYAVATNRRWPLAISSLAGLVPFLVSGTGPLTWSGVEAGAFVSTRAGMAAPDLEVIVQRWPHPTLLSLRWALRAAARSARRLRRTHRLSPLVEGVALGPTILQPRSVGHIELSSADPFAAPVIQPNYLSDTDGEDLRVLSHGVRLARQMTGSSAFRPYFGAELLPGPGVRTDEEIEAFIRSHATTLQHPVGTCRMGPDDMAVVDPQLRVRGLDRLRVVDASVMPVITRGHMNAPTIMIAEKAADLISGARSPDHLPS